MSKPFPVQTEICSDCGMSWSKHLELARADIGYDYNYEPTAEQIVEAVDHLVCISLLLSKNMGPMGPPGPAGAMGPQGLPG